MTGTSLEEVADTIHSMTRPQGDVMFELGEDEVTAKARVARALAAFKQTGFVPNEKSLAMEEREDAAG